MEKIKTEKKELFAQIEKYILSQNKPFLAFVLAKEWYKDNGDGILTKKSSVATYFSQVCNNLYDGKKIKIKEIQHRGDSLPRKIYVVV